jgi:hypothetical protein
VTIDNSQHPRQSPISILLLTFPGSEYPKGQKYLTLGERRIDEEEKENYGGNEETLLLLDDLSKICSISVPLAIENGLDLDCVHLLPVAPV